MSKIFHTEYLYNGIFFLYIFFLTSTISNAGLSISLALLLLLLITLFIKKRMNIPMPNTTYLILYSIFFGGLIFVSFFSPSSQSKYFTLKYFYWTLPFWVVYLYIIEIPSFISWGRALATSLLILMSKAFFQFFSLPLGTRITSFFYSGNGFAAVLELIIPFLLIYFIECKKRNYWVESKLMPHNNIAYFFSATGTIGGISYFVYVFGVLFLLICNIRKCPNNLYYQAALWSFLAITVHGMVDSGITNKFSMQILSACLGITFSSEYVNTSQLKKEENDF